MLDDLGNKATDFLIQAVIALIGASAAALSAVASVMTARAALTTAKAQAPGPGRHRATAPARTR